MRADHRALLAGTVAATAAYLFTRLSFTGELHLLQLGVFAVFFVVVQGGFWWFLGWAVASEG